MFGSPKQVAWAESIRNKVILAIQNNLDRFPIPERLIELFEATDDASWWINNRNEFCSLEHIMVFGLVLLAQLGEAHACDEIVKIHENPAYEPLFEKFRVQPDPE